MRYKINTTSKTELLILNFIAKFGYVEEIHIISFTNLNKIYCQKLLRKLVAMQLIIREKILHNRDYYIYLSKYGAKILQIKLPSKPVLHTLLHDSMLVQLYLYLSKFNPNLIITVDKELKRHNNKILDSKFRLPDLLINNKIAIELELSQKNDVRLQEIVHNYIKDINYSLIIYIVKNLTIMNKIKTIINNISDKFYFYLLDDNLDINNLKLCNDNSLEILELINNTPNINIHEKFGNFTYIKFFSDN